MSLSFRLRTAEFSNEIERIIKATQKEAAVVIREEGALFIKDVVKLTPPFGGAPSTESLTAQRRIGEAAVERDAKRGQRGGMEAGPAATEDSAFARAKGLTKWRLDYLIRTKNIEALTAIMKNMRMKVVEIIDKASQDRHNAARDSRGRIRRFTGVWVLNQRSLDRLINKLKREVGKAKAGWAEAAAALGVKLPSWITRHRTAGGQGFQDFTSDKKRPRIIVTNGVPFIQATGAELRIVERALQNRVRNMRKKLERVARAGWRPK